MNEHSQGEAFIGGSGIMPNQDLDQIAIAVFSVLDNFNDYTRISITDLQLNDNDPIPIAASSILHNDLGVIDQSPIIFALHQNYPNPFNPVTAIRYDLPKESMVDIVVYDITGRLVKNLVYGNKKPGYHYTTWNGINNLGNTVSAGMYIYTIQADQFQSVKKMILLK